MPPLFNSVFLKNPPFWNLQIWIFPENTSWVMSTFFTGRTDMCRKRQQRILASRWLGAQMAAACEKGQRPCHCTSWKTEGEGTHTHTHNTSRLGFFLRTSLIAGAISPLKSWPKCLRMQSCCNGQKFRVKCQWKRNEQHRLLCVGSVSREEWGGGAQRGQTLARLTTTKRCPWPPPWTGHSQI